MWRITTLVSLFLLALALGVSFSHLLQAGPKATLPVSDFLTIQQVLLRRYGLGVGLVEGGTVVAVAITAFSVRHEPRQLHLTVVTLVCLLAMIAIWAIAINPINAQINSWSAATVPENWRDARDSWHRLHAMRFGLAAIAFAAFGWSAVGTSARMVPAQSN